ncbi:MAG TPA: hypothetical protein VFW65_35210 [Pseudonocardiaceae bacterium]|nr:hypothetical protein [Pseudonocardiaceae bacterium]
MRNQPTDNHRAFWIDDAYDRDQASNGHSRYGAYLADRADQFHEDGQAITDPVQFARLAFTIASSPIMAPGYVHSHPRVLDVLWQRDDEARMAIQVRLAAPLPEPIATVIGRDRRPWADWSRPWPGTAWFEPYDNDRPGAYTTVAVRIPLDPSALSSLPAPAYRRGEPNLATAQAAVRAVCGHLNTALADILAALGR